MLAMRALPWRLSVVMPACGPLRLIAGTPSAWRAIDTSVALWCSPVARSMSSSRSSGVVGDRGGQAEQLVGRVAHRRDDDDEVRAGGALAGDPPGHPPDPIGVGEAGATELLNDEGAADIWRILPRTF